MSSPLTNSILPIRVGVGSEVSILLGWILFPSYRLGFPRLPEPKGRTYGEMDVLFARGISARKFKETKLDIFRGDHLVPVKEKDSASDVYVEKA